MIYTQNYMSPLGNILLAADSEGLTGLWFEGQKYFGNGLTESRSFSDSPALSETKRWLDVYFSGKNPDFTPPLRPAGTPFQKTVWNILLQIPYGETITYGEISRRITGGQKMSAQAVGGAVGHNRISVIIPCHRVVGSNGSLTGYAGGIDKKIRLMELEQIDMSGFFVPKKGSAL